MTSKNWLDFGGDLGHVMLGEGLGLPELDTDQFLKPNPIRPNIITWYGEFIINEKTAQRDANTVRWL